MPWSRNRSNHNGRHRRIKVDSVVGRRRHVVYTCSLVQLYHSTGISDGLAVICGHRHLPPRTRKRVDHGLRREHERLVWRNGESW